jgi:hypothetical protein
VPGLKDEHRCKCSGHARFLCPKRGAALVTKLQA